MLDQKIVLKFGDIVTTEEESYVVTGWLQGSIAPKNTVSIQRDNKIIYENIEGEKNG